MDTTIMTKKMSDISNHYSLSVTWIFRKRESVTVPKGYSVMKTKNDLS